MKLSQIEKRVPQTLTNSKDTIQKDGVIFLGTDTSFAHPPSPAKNQLNPEIIICRDPDPGSFSICEIY